MIVRWLFLILLVLNLLLFVWGYQQPQPESYEAPPHPGNTPTILLLSESTTSETHTGAVEETGLTQVRDETDAAVVQTPELKDETVQSAVLEEKQAVLASEGIVLDEAKLVVEKLCVKLGPFDQEAETFNMIAVLDKSGHEASLDINRTHEQSGYWVLIPAGSDDPDFLVANLELAGVDDVWRFSKGELAGAVSLGLYSDRVRAEQRRDELTEKGFNAKIHPRQLEQLSFWIKTRYYDKDALAAAALDQLFNANPRMSYPAPQCAESVETGENIQ